MKIENLGLSAISPYEKNPRKNDSAVNGVAESIKQFGFLQPIVIDQYGIIVAGHTRYKAAKKLGLESVPCVRVENLTEEQVKAYRILDNKLNEIAVWDFDALQKEMESFEFNFNEFEVKFPTFDAGSYFSENTQEQTESQEDEDDLFDDSDLPDELQGIDIEKDELPKIEGDDKRANERVIIVYPQNLATEVAGMLGVSEIDRVVYTLDDVLEARNEN